MMTIKERETFPLSRHRISSRSSEGKALCDSVMRRVDWTASVAQLNVPPRDRSDISISHHFRDKLNEYLVPLIYVFSRARN